MNLSPTEVRVLGCLLEKQRTTPDAYPLSLNALRLACNQSTARDPVVDYDDVVIRDALHRLERRGHTRLASGAGSRAPKYRHLLAEALPMADDEQAVICVLMLRGPQTPGELKQRTERMHPFAGLDEVHETLAKLIERKLAARAGRRPGQKEERYAQLLSEDYEQGSDVPDPAGPVSIVPGPAAAGGSAVDSLQERVSRLEREVAELRAGQRAAVGAGRPAIDQTEQAVSEDREPGESGAAGGPDGWETSRP